MEYSIFQVVYLRNVLLQNMSKDDFMNDIKKLLGKRIKYFREQKNITQEQLAERVGINSRSISLIECGSNFITAQTLTSIANALNVSPKRLFDFEDEFNNELNIKEKLFDLINKNEDKIYTIYKIIKGYLE